MIHAKEFIGFRLRDFLSLFLCFFCGCRFLVYWVFVSVALVVVVVFASFFSSFKMFELCAYESAEHALP